MLRKTTLIAAIAGTVIAGSARAPIARSTTPTHSDSRVTRTLPPVRKAPTTAGPQAPTTLNAKAKAPATVYSIPFAMSPTAEQMQNECVVIDANNDAVDGYNTWTYSEYFESPIYWKGSNAGDANDWLVFPAINFTDASKAYKVSIDAASTYTGDTSAEAFEVRIGTAPTVEALDHLILSRDDVNEALVFNTYEGVFGVPAAGTYYIAVRCTSTAAAGWRLLARNIKVEATDYNSAIPSACTNLSATLLVGEQLRASVEFDLPRVSVNGVDLPSDKQLTATITAPTGTSPLYGKPGDHLSTTVDVVEGINNITIVASNEYGSGESASVSVRCNYDIPSLPVLHSQVSDDNYTLHLTWDPVTTGANGGTIDPKGVTYDVFSYNTATEAWDVIKADLPYTETSFTISVPETQALGFCDLAVGSKNSQGSLNDATIISELLGTPYTLPLNETLADRTFHYTGLTIDTPSDEYNAGFGAVDPSQLDESFANPNGAALVGICQNTNGGRGHLTLPKFTTAGCGPVQVVLPIFLFSGTPEIRVYAHLNNGTSIDMGTVDISEGEGWTNVTFSLPDDYLNCQCINLSLDIKFDNSYQYFLMSGYTVREGIVNDFAVSDVTVTPTTIEPGKKAVVTASLRNTGMRAANAPAISGYVAKAGKKVADLTFTTANQGEIPVNGLCEYTAEYTVTSAEYVGTTLNIVVNITDPDGLDSNNSLTVQANVAGSELPLITDLSAHFDDADGSIALSWTTPLVDEAVEGFEFLPVFSFDSPLGPWLNLDYDNANTYTLEVENISIPNDTEPKAFQVMSASQTGLGPIADIYGYNNSDRFLMAFSAQGVPTDDWLISPEIKGGTDLSIMWDIVTKEYTETIEVLYSTTGRDTDSFRNKLGTFTKSTIGWEEIALQLPDEARYFAIRYCSNDCFGIMLDDITYYPAKPEYELSSIKVIRDNEVIDELPADADSYVDRTAVRDTFYTYYVMPVFYHQDMPVDGLRSNAASLAASGINDVNTFSGIYAVNGAIVINGHEGELITVTDLQGRVVARVTPTASSTTVALPAGFYIAAGTKLIVK